MWPSSKDAVPSSWAEICLGGGGLPVTGAGNLQLAHEGKVVEPVDVLWVANEAANIVVLANVAEDCHGSGIVWMLRNPDVGVDGLEFAQMAEEGLHVVQRRHDAVSAHHLDAAVSLKLRNASRALADLDFAALLDCAMGFEGGLDDCQLGIGEVRRSMKHTRNWTIAHGLAPPFSASP